jgi:hypothetical protein
MPSCTYYGTYVPCSPYTHPEYHAYSSQHGVCRCLISQLSGLIFVLKGFLCLGISLITFCLHPRLLPQLLTQLHPSSALLIYTKAVLRPHSKYWAKHVRNKNLACAVSPFTKLGNSTMREEHDDSIWKKGYCLRVKNSFANSTKMDFMRR